MTIAIITESGVRKVAPMVILAQQAAALAQQAAGISAAVASERYYASYAAGNAATTTGQYFAVLGSGAYDFHIHGNATPVVKLPVLDGSGNLGVGVASPSDRVHIPYNAAVRWGSPGTQGVRLSFFFDGGGNQMLLDTGSVNGEETKFFFATIAPDGDKHFFGVDNNGPGFEPAFRPLQDNINANGTSATRWKEIHAGTGSIITSDRDAKTEIGCIPDEWLDAWANVEWVRFKFIGGSRWHPGLIAQQVYEAFAAHDIDAFEIGLCCFDEWGAQEEALGDEGEIIRPAIVAGSRWGLRYDECQAMEAAYQRREIARLKAQVAAL